MNSDSDQDFGAILAAFESGHETTPEPKVGEKATGSLVTVGRDTSFVDLGGKSEGMVATAELLDDEGDLAFAPGDEVTGVVTGRDPESGCYLLRVRPGRGEAARGELNYAREHGIPVEGVVTGVNKGGLDVEVAGIRAFCPVSQIDLGFVEDPSTYVGRRLSFRITKLAEGRHDKLDVVLSRRALLQEEAARQAEEAKARLKPGETVRGTVSSVTSYGAFVDLGGVEGLLHVSEMSHARVDDPNELFQEGQSIEVQVLKIEEREDKKGRPATRISLSRKSLEDDPWSSAAERFPVGTRVVGRVMRLQDFGAFVELAPGLDGLVHISELEPGRRIQHPRESVELGQDLEVVVLAVDAERRRISLSRVHDGTDRQADAQDLEDAARRAAGPGGFGSLGDFFKGGPEEESEGEGGGGPGAG
jgi:small subunit ribosomal protein S1